MKEIKINIKELGAVRNSIIELKPMMIFSGESGLGKSYVAILVHYFYKLLAENRLQGFFDAEDWDFEKMIQNNHNNGKLSLNTSQLLEWINEDAKVYMRKSVGNPELPISVAFDIPFEQLEYTFSYKTVKFGIEGKEQLFYVFELENTIMRVNVETKNIGVQPWYMLLEDVLRKKLFENDKINQTFAMVPGRGALLNIPVTMQERIKNNGDIYSEFLSDWDVVRSMLYRSSKDADLVDLLSNINGGKIDVDENDHIVYRISDEKSLPISAAASSIKELAPLYMLLDKYPCEQLSILFEEPEAHLHPQKQIDIADFVVRAVNKGSHMQITTHSDYFLRRLNDRIFLHKIYEDDPIRYKKTLEKYVYSDLKIDPSLIGAYILLRKEDGSVNVVSQQLDRGIPYESFYNVIKKETNHSLDIQQTYYNIKSNYVESI